MTRHAFGRHSGGADRVAKFLARYRNRVWRLVASVDVIRWDTSRHTGRTDSFVHGRCIQRREAEEAARGFYENAKYCQRRKLGGSAAETMAVSIFKDILRMTGNLAAQFRAHVIGLG